MFFGFLVIGSDMKILFAVIAVLVLGFVLVQVQPMQNLWSTLQETPVEAVTGVDQPVQGNSKKASLLKPVLSEPREMQGRRTAASNKRVASYQRAPSQRNVSQSPKTGSSAYQTERRAMSTQGAYPQQRQDYAKSYDYNQQRAKSQAYARSINQAQQNQGSKQQTASFQKEKRSSSGVYSDYTDSAQVQNANQGRPAVASSGSIAQYRSSGTQSGVPNYQSEAFDAQPSQAAANQRNSSSEQSRKLNYQKSSESVPCTYKNGQVTCR